jgi:2-dehydro-3-deoxygluconokinase
LTYDLVTLGEVLLRLSVPAPARFETTRQLDVQIGGAEANVAAACARLGLATAWISALPANEWGERVRRELTAHGVDCTHVRTITGARMGVYFLEYGASPRPIRVLYDRRDSAFARLTPADVDWEPIRRARLVHLSGVTPALGQGPRDLVRRALQEAPTISFDVNYRAKLWSPADARAFVAELLPAAAYLFVGQAEARQVFGLTGSPERVLEALARQAPKATIALLQGQDGATVLADGRLVRAGRRYHVQMVDPVGAGDAYVAGFLWALLRGRGVEEAAEAGSAVAALKCSTWGDIALVSVGDVQATLADGPDIDR